MINEEIVGDDVILPGFRFHPTDEELVGFYLKRKIQQLPLSIELIRQLDIYKYDPWDLPSKFSSQSLFIQLNFECTDIFMSSISKSISNERSSAYLFFLDRMLI